MLRNDEAPRTGRPRPRGGDGRTFLRLLRPDPLEIRAALLDLRSRLGAICDSDSLGRLELAVAEVLNNITEHAAPAGGWPQCSPPIRLLVTVQDDSICCRVADEGEAAPRGCYSRPVRPRPWLLPEGGFGLCLLGTLAEQVDYRRINDRNVLTFSLERVGQAA